MLSSLLIAVADDEPSMREFLCRVLRHFGHRISVAAENGRQLVNACRNHSPDLIITDYAMPELDGLDAVREICCDHTIPSIIVSGKDLVRIQKPFWGDSVFGVLVKPVRMDDIQPVITLAMNRFQREQILQRELCLLRTRTETELN